MARREQDRGAFAGGATPAPPGRERITAMRLLSTFRAVAVLIVFLGLPLHC
jgi:hypothetical protein